jgi:hypothetical protein
MNERLSPFGSSFCFLLDWSLHSSHLLQHHNQVKNFNIHMVVGPVACSFFCVSLLFIVFVIQDESYDARSLEYTSGRIFFSK